MTRLKQSVFVAAFTGLLITGMAGWVSAQDVDRLAATKQYDGERITSVPAGVIGTDGLLVYSKAVFVPGKVTETAALFVTFSGTGDTHGGAALLMSCYVDFPAVPCMTGDTGAGPNPSGWVTLQKTPAGTGATNCNDGSGGDGDCHDNSVTYTWCTRVTAGAHTVNLSLASSDGVSNVYYERALILVDAVHGSKAAGLCLAP